MKKQIKKLFNAVNIRFRLLLADEHEKAALYRKYFGVKLGKNVRFTGMPGWGSEPYLIEIGDNVTITQDVTFHTHDGGVGIFRKEYPGINVFGRIVIGNNVFIGSHTIFLPGVRVGNSVVIGAGSVVSRDIPDNSLAVGVPARVIKTIDEYKNGILKKAVYVFSNDPLKRKKEIINIVK